MRDHTREKYWRVQIYPIKHLIEYVFVQLQKKYIFLLNAIFIYICVNVYNYKKKNRSLILNWTIACVAAIRPPAGRCQYCTACIYATSNKLFVVVLFLFNIAALCFASANFWTLFERDRVYSCKCDKLIVSARVQWKCLADRHGSLLRNGIFVDWSRCQGKEFMCVCVFFLSSSSDGLNDLMLINISYIADSKNYILMLMLGFIEMKKVFFLERGS